jgi:hypothetical protein
VHKIKNKYLIIHIYKIEKGKTGNLFDQTLRLISLLLFTISVMSCYFQFTGEEVSQQGSKSFDKISSIQCTTFDFIKEKKFFVNTPEVF